jgi:hypothetical protein
MVRIEWIPIHITAGHIRLAVIFALATAVFLNLTVMHRTKTAKVVEDVWATGPAANDMIDMSSSGAASYHCANVAITMQCGGAESAPRCGSIECLIRHTVTSGD